MWIIKYLVAVNNKSDLIVIHVGVFHAGNCSRKLLMIRLLGSKVGRGEIYLINPGEKKILEYFFNFIERGFEINIRKNKSSFSVSIK